VWQDRLGHPDHPEEVHVEHALGLFDGTLLGGAPGADSSVVDEHIDPPEPADHLIDEIRHRLLAGDVEVEERDLVAGHGVGRLATRSDHVEPSRHECGGRRLTDARRRTCHEGHWPRTCHPVLRFAGLVRLDYDRTLNCGVRQAETKRHATHGSKPRTVHFGRASAQGPTSHARPYDRNVTVCRPFDPSSHVKGPLMAHGDEHKQATRQRIVEHAAPLQAGRDRRLGRRDPHERRGLTNGAFYGHSPEGGACHRGDAEELREQRSSSVLEPGFAGLEQFGGDCPSSIATIPAPVARPGRCSTRSCCSVPTRQAYTDGMVGIMDDFAAHLSPEDLDKARGRCSASSPRWSARPSSRAIADHQLADAVLDQARTRQPARRRTTPHATKRRRRSP
jgi:hypothetical protein